MDKLSLAQEIECIGVAWMVKPQRLSESMVPTADS